MSAVPSAHALVRPDSAAVCDLFTELLCHEVSVRPSAPMDEADLGTAALAVYADADQQLYAVLGMQLPLAAGLAAALGPLPAGAAGECVAASKLTAALSENLFQLCKVLTRLLNAEGCPPVKLYQVVFPGVPVPPEAAAQLLAPGRRLDLAVEVARYGTGKLSVSLA